MLGPPREWRRKRGSRHRFDTRSMKCTRWTAGRRPAGVAGCARSGQPCPKRAAAQAPAGRQPAMGEAALPLAPSARPTHDQAALPGTRNRDAPRHSARCRRRACPQTGSRTARCASRKPSLSTRSDRLIELRFLDLICSAPGGAVCRSRTAPAACGSRPIARPAWPRRTAPANVAPRLRSARRNQRAPRFGSRAPSDTGRGALRHDDPNALPVSRPRLPWGAPYTGVNP